MNNNFVLDKTGYYTPGELLTIIEPLLVLSPVVLLLLLLLGVFVCILAQMFVSDATRFVSVWDIVQRSILAEIPNSEQTRPRGMRCTRDK